MSCPGWPALEHGLEPLPRELSYQRGIWGKAHGAISDFRWLACSPGFDRDRRLYQQLAIGNEDRLTSSAQWRSLADGTCCAVSGYTSRASDAYGRSGFLESQIVQWRHQAAVPPALGALLLMAKAGQLNDQSWWEHRTDERWQDRSFLLTIDDAFLAIPVHKETLDDLIRRAIEALSPAVDAAALARLYAALLAGSRPAYIAVTDCHLSAVALAALLLPLPRRIADHLALATWTPADMYLRPEQAAGWDIIAGRPPATETIPTPDTRAESMARALLDNDPGRLALPAAPARVSTPVPALTETSRKPLAMPEHEHLILPDPAPPLQAFQARPGIQLELTPADRAAPEIVQWIYRFARSADRRWLDDEDIAQACHQPGPLVVVRREADLLCQWVSQVQQQRPPLADPDEWQVKVELLQAVILALVPDPEIIHTIGLPTSGRVPALLLAPHLGPGSRDFEKAYGASFKAMVDQSLACRDAELVRRIKDWLEPATTAGPPG